MKNTTTQRLKPRMRKIKDLKVCGECAYYHKRAFGEAICLRTGRVIAYLAQRECWTKIGTVKIEDIKPTKIKKSELPSEKIVSFENFDTNEEYDEED